MKRFGALLVAMLIAGIIGAAPALAQDMEGPYVEPGQEERPPTPVPTVRPAPVVDDGVAPVVLPREVTPPVARALPVTGFSLTIGAVLALGLFVAGGGALLLARRKAAAAAAG